MLPYPQCAHTKGGATLERAGRMESTVRLISQFIATLATVGVLLVDVAAQATVTPERPATPREGAVVVPHWESANGTLEFADSWLVPRPRDAPTHQQYAYDVQDFGIASGELVAVAFRHNANRLSRYPATVCKMSVSLWHAPFPANGLQQRFAANVGPDRTLVFAGKVAFPARNWTDPPTFDARIAFQRPFSFDRSKGKSLVMDIRSQSSTLLPHEDWICAAAKRDYGFPWVQHTYPSRLCWNSPTGGYKKTILLQFYPGGKVQGRWEELPSNAFCFESFGPLGHGGIWLGQKLPIPLIRGVCYWGAASVVFFPFTTDSRGTGYPQILHIPSDRRVVGTRFYEQSGCIMPGYNSLGFVTLFSLEYIIGTAHVPKASFHGAVLDNPPSAWSLGVFRNIAVLARFEYH